MRTQVRTILKEPQQLHLLAQGRLLWPKAEHCQSGNSESENVFAVGQGGGHAEHPCPKLCFLLHNAQAIPRGVVLGGRCNDVCRKSEVLSDDGTHVSPPLLAAGPRNLRIQRGVHMTL